MRVFARQRVIALGCLSGLMFGAAAARAASLTCPLLRILSTTTSQESEEAVLRAVGHDREAPPRATSSAAGKDEVTIVALGPVLDSLDSREIEVTPACTAGGAMLTATITRYSGGAKKNVLWRPRIRIAVTLGRSEAQFQTTWRVRRPDGTELDHRDAQRYPITVTTPIRPR